MSMIQAYGPTDLLEPKEKLQVERCKVEIVTKLRRTMPDMMAIGRLLTEIRDILQPTSRETGGFTAWVDNDFDMCRATAYRFMRLWEKLKDREHLLNRVSPTVALELGTCQPEVLDIVEQALDEGREVGMHELENWKEKFPGEAKKLTPVEVFSNGMRNLTRKHPIPIDPTTAEEVALLELRDYCGETIKQIDEATRGRHE